jgi:hypothetical protein
VDVTALGTLVGHVLLMRTEAQVRRIAAGRVVALVEDVRAFWRLSVRQNPGVSVRGQGAWLAVVPAREPAVAVPLPEAHVEPATAGVRSLIDLRPEAGRPLGLLGSHVAGSAAVFVLATGGLAAVVGAGLHLRIVITVADSVIASLGIEGL